VGNNYPASLVGRRVTALLTVERMCVGQVVAHCGGRLTIQTTGIRSLTRMGWDPRKETVAVDADYCRPVD
jgi:hypothetical protein